MKDLIRKAIQEEVARKYTKGDTSIDKMVYKWLNHTFEGAQMYMKKHWAHMYSFEWCNNGLELLTFMLYFDRNDEFEDNRELSERDFSSGTLSIPKDLVDTLSSLFPVRKNYLRYLIEEWFEDTLLQDVQNKMGRNDVTVDELAEYPDKAQVCVPPVVKREDVTEAEMIDRILKSTLFRMEDILRYEEEEPGWIEQTYLEKLRGDEMRRLRGN
jgi:hypothetical protein